MVIPAYNEEKEIIKVLDRLKKSLAGVTETCEVIVINDASTDNTEKALINRSDIKLINNSRNLGYGASLKKGIGIAKHETIAIIDADNTYPAEEISNFLSFIGDYDMVVGARRKIIYPTLNWIKQWGRDVIDWLCSYLVGGWIPDINSGLRVFKKSIVLRFINQLCDRFSFTTALTLLMFFNECKVKYLPIDYQTNQTESVSKVRIWRDGLRTFLIIIKLGFRYVPSKVIVLIVILFLLLFFIFNITLI